MFCPCGYFVINAFTSILGSPETAFCNFSIQSFCYPLQQKHLLHLGIKKGCDLHSADKIFCILEHSSVICSDIRFTLSTVCNNIFYLIRFLRESFYLVGNPAPPIPTIPASPILLMISSLVISSKGFTGSYSTSFILSIVFYNNALHLGSS